MQSIPAGLLFVNRETGMGDGWPVSMLSFQLVAEG